MEKWQSQPQTIVRKPHDEPVQSNNRKTTKIRVPVADVQHIGDPSLKPKPSIDERHRQDVSLLSRHIFRCQCDSQPACDL